MLGSSGAVWGVTREALPLAPGSIFTLTMGDKYYWPSLSSLPATLPARAWVYAQVDSYNPATDYGNVRELDESDCSDAYNNVFSLQLTAPITLSATAVGQSTSSDLLPPRR